MITITKVTTNGIDWQFRPFASRWGAEQRQCLVVMGLKTNIEFNCQKGWERITHPMGVMMWGITLHTPPAVYSISSFHGLILSRPSG